MRKRQQQSGSVLLIVLWTAVLLTILVTAMASKVRLSARTAFNNQLAADDYTQMMSALNSAEMDILLERMSSPLDAPIETNSEGESLDCSLRFRLVVELVERVVVEEFHGHRRDFVELHRR